MNDDEALELFESVSNWGRWGPDDTIGTAKLHHARGTRTRGISRS